MPHYFALFGLACVVASLVLVIRRIAFLRHGIRTLGTVVGFETRDSGDAIMYAPRVEFHDEHGRKHTISAQAGRARREPAVGTQVEIIYPSEAPGRACIASFFHLWAKPLVSFIMGAVALLVYAAVRTGT